MQQAARQGFVAWLVAFVLVVCALFAFLGAPGSAEGAGEAIGRLFAHTGVAALATWAIARNRTPAWGGVRFGLVYLAIFVVLAVVTAIGRMGGDVTAGKNVGDGAIDPAAAVASGARPGGAMLTRRSRLVVAWIVHDRGQAPGFVALEPGTCPAA
jgi:hypothetical protein